MCEFSKKLVYAALFVLHRTKHSIVCNRRMGCFIPNIQADYWDVDFYMSCCFNVMKHQLRLSSSITGISNHDEAFDEEDVPVMLKTVQSVTKPCLVFKLLGAGRVCLSDALIEERFRYVLKSIKPIDCIVVGTWQKTRDEIAMNAAIVKKYGFV